VCTAQSRGRQIAAQRAASSTPPPIKAGKAPIAAQALPSGSAFATTGALPGSDKPSRSDKGGPVFNRRKWSTFQPALTVDELRSNDPGLLRYLAERPSSDAE
jgi:hypothetical protein